MTNSLWDSTIDKTDGMEVAVATHRTKRVCLLGLLDYDLLLPHMDGAYVPKTLLTDRCSRLKPGV